MSEVILENNILADEVGPERIVILRDPSLKLKAVIVIDNSVYGIPAGGLRMAPDITLQEMIRLARAMTLKFCTYRVPMGGAKSGIIADPINENKNLLITSYAHLISPYIKENIYYCGTDMGTTNSDRERIFKIAGKFEALFPNIEFTRRGNIIEDHFTGYGVVFCLETIYKKHKHLEESTTKPKIILEGFGKVGKSVLLRLKELRYRLMGLSTIKGAIYDEDGLNIKKLLDLREKFGDDSVNKYESKNLVRIEKEKLFELSSDYPTDYLIPGARPDIINKNNIEKINAKAIISAANIPYAKGMIDILEQKGITAFPDFVSNGGAVLIESMMFNSWSVDQLYEHLKARITTKTIEILNGTYENHTNTYEFAKSEAIKELNKHITKRKRKIERLSKRF